MELLLRMKFKDYVAQTKHLSNNATDLSVLSAPFGLVWEGPADAGLPLGCVIDALSESLTPNDWVDCLDVATAAWDLGCVDAERFLNEAPDLIYKNLKQKVVN